MTGRIGARLARLEREADPPWCEWIGRPPREWPDDALEARIRDGAGLSPDVELTDGLLDALIADAEGRLAGGFA